MPASDQHPEYRANIDQWETTRDCVDGSTAIKQAGTKYLPKPNRDDISPENNTRYSDYLKRANFVNFTGSTLDGMLGMVFRNPITVDINATIEYLEENINGAGITLDQMARSLVGDLLKTGRFGMLVDYPTSDPGLTQAEVADLNLRANVLSYEAECVINWRTTTIGGITVLSLVVLAEDHEVISADGFSVETKTYHRVLRLTKGVYTQELLNENDELVELMTPRKNNGSMWDRIPFVFVGAENNDANTDKAPLYDIAEINISHYRNSADFEESSFMVGQPTPVIAGLSQSWADTILKKGVILGSRRAVLLPEGGSADLLQADPNQMPSAGMDRKEQQMIKIGARIIQDTSGVETAEAARIRFAGQNSKLGAIVGNVESAFLQVFIWAMDFMGGEGDPEIEINKDFYEKTADPQLIMALIQTLDRGAIAMTDFRGSLRDVGVIDKDRTDEEIEGEAERQEVI
jgi:hypothetical protein